MSLNLPNITIIRVLSPARPDDPTTVALPADATVDEYYMTWLRQNLDQLHGFIAGFRTAYDLPQMTREEWALELEKFEAELAGLPGASAEHALRAFRAYRSR